ncbi:type II toxin-antitoxin system PemK/MazF family toxin [uncultured Lacticaseibacillus sp.]|uniref:type II toxin-antitoxin system PemK/MazF family toxin n=1 Tax=uncultured Lacticaseibacillus sp. TaxID=2775882 RepID=UPI002596CB23|nr:type II toxin-antitoxin system PemK/MazF family toxin [uncultured Lacticaseibacillus sp.]
MGLVVHQGDLVWIDAEPYAGHEQGGHDPEHGNIRRPMIVISTSSYYQYTGLIIGMPITHAKSNQEQIRPPINDQKSGISGSVITYQMQNYDFEAGNGKVVGRMPRSYVQMLLPIAVGAFGIDL